jgi:hypothetical protein
MCRGQYTSVIQSIAVQIDYYAAVLWVWYTILGDAGRVINEYISLTGGYNHGYTQLNIPLHPQIFPKIAIS